MWSLSPNDEIVVSITFIWRCFLAVCVCGPPLYVLWRIFAAIKTWRNDKESQLGRLLKGFLKPGSIAILGIWIAAIIYVFGYAYVWPIGVKVLSYSLFEIKNLRSCPDSHRISIIPEDPLIGRSGKDYAATCISAARHYAKKLNSKAVIVDVYAFPPVGFSYGYDARLAHCVHDPSDWLWIDPDVDKRTRAVADVSSQRLKINQLSAFLADDYRDKTGIASLDNKALNAKIAALVSCPLVEAEAVELSLVPVFSSLLDTITATPPINPEREKLLPRLNEIKELVYSFDSRADKACYFTAISY